MQTRNPIFDDFARVFSGAVGAASGVRGEVEARVRAQLERILADMDLVPREEFEAVQAMAAKAREEQEVIADRLAALEARLDALEGEAVSKPKAHSASKDQPPPSEA
ncbi:accessory factor UbiK family protein [Aquibaculum arenosum]|nr:accessory factor UbiK family protein [Fodinicurvata sp. CAU 1616]